MRQILIFFFLFAFIAQAKWKAPWCEVPNRSEYSLYDPCSSYQWNTIEKDVFAFDVYNACAERLSVFGEKITLTNFYIGFTSTTQPRRVNAQLLQTAKNRVKDVVVKYINHTDLSEKIDNWTLKEVIDHLDLPSNYFDYTPPRNYWGAQPISKVDAPLVESGRTTTDYGWCNLKRVLLLCKYAERNPDFAEAKIEDTNISYVFNGTNEYTFTEEYNFNSYKAYDSLNPPIENASSNLVRTTNGVWNGEFTAAYETKNTRWKDYRNAFALIDAPFKLVTYDYSEFYAECNSYVDETYNIPDYDQQFILEYFTSLYKLEYKMSGSDSYSQTKEVRFRFNAPEETCQFPALFDCYMYGKRVYDDGTLRYITTTVERTVHEFKEWTIDDLCPSDLGLFEKGPTATWMGDCEVGGFSRSFCFSPYASISLDGTQGNYRTRTTTDIFRSRVKSTTTATKYTLIKKFSNSFYGDLITDSLPSYGRAGWDEEYFNAFIDTYKSEADYKFSFSQTTNSATTINEDDKNFIEYKKTEKTIKSKPRQYEGYTAIVYLIGPHFLYN